MVKKINGGIMYKFDVGKIGRISIEREYNNTLNLDAEGISLMREVNAFAHSLDFKSKNNVLTNPNSYIFLIKDNIPDVDNYFENNLRKHVCNNREFIDFLIDICFDESLNIDENSPDTMSFVKLADILKKLTDFILYDDYSDIDEQHTIGEDDTETLNFMKNIKLLYGDNYKRATRAGASSNDISLEYPDEYYIPIVSFKNYNDIKTIFSPYISPEFFDNLSIIIGYSNMFRYCGLFTNRTNTYKSLNKLYHLLIYYPVYGDIAKKNKYIRELYKETYFTLIEITKRIYKICTGIKLNKTNIKSRSMPRSTKKSEKTQRSSTRLSKK
jgi:hypothetical protein